MTFGKKQAKTVDWSEAHMDKMQPFTDEKRHALASYKSLPSERTLQMLRAARKKPNRFQGFLQTNFDFTCAMTYRSVLTQAI